MQTLLFILSATMGLTLFFIVWAIWTLNQMRTLETRCQQAQNDIDVQLKQRNDLIPNFVETVRSFVGQETYLLNTLRDIQSEIHANANIQNRTMANANISNSLNNAFSSLEHIPELQSSAHYVSLRNQLQETENKIAASRRFLNLTVSEFNAKRLQFPGYLIASYININEKTGYDLGGDRVFYDEAPVVKL